jgi:hypothetical protein
VKRDDRRYGICPDMSDEDCDYLAQAENLIPQSRNLISRSLIRRSREWDDNGSYRQESFDRTLLLDRSFTSKRV